MRRTQLGRTGIEVSAYCLGTMTFGTNTSEEEGHRQLDASLDFGIDFLDTAEMYPVNPVRAETVGVTEQILGTWNAKNPGRRGDYTLATKITGKNGSFVRVGEDITAETFTQALDTSLGRLQTDHVEIYQLHWPNRGSYHFRQNWGYDPSGQDKTKTLANMAEVLEAADAAQKAGKIGHFALSNESAWGTAQWIRIAEEKGLPRVQSIQNEYSLLCRHYDTDLAELAVNEQVTLLAYSPLAAGLLTGKYQGGAVPKGSRREANHELGGRATERAFAAVDAYLDIARRHGLDPVHMALAFTVQRPFPVSTIFGATTSEQLAHIVEGLDVTLDAAVLEEIDATHRAMPMTY